MDIQTIDNQFNQLQNQSQQTVGEIRDLAQKLQAAAQAGNQDAREWLLDLKSIALAFQAEQNQVASLLNAVHGYIGNQNQALQQAPWAAQPAMQAPYPQQNYGGGYPQQQGGFLGGFLNSGFGRAIVTGAGFGIGDDLINKIF